MRGDVRCMNRKQYWREYHERNRDRRNAAALARYYASGGNKTKLIKEYESKKAQGHSPV